MKKVDVAMGCMLGAMAGMFAIPSWILIKMFADKSKDKTDGKER